MTPSITAEQVPALPFIHFDAEGHASLRGMRCGACNAVLLGAPRACASCGARGQLQPVQLSQRGRLHTFTVIHRSFPGVKTPFVAGVVELEGGGALKGTLLDVPADPAALRFDMPIDVVFRDTGQRDGQGRAFISYYFVPAQGAAQ